jgi:linoleoyl-CoA desaturase
MTNKSTLQTETSTLPAQRDLESFRRELDALHARIRAKMGQEDLDYIARVDRWSRVAMWTGRALVAFSPGPLSFLAGVTVLAAGKQLQATEVGHTVLHGAFDRVESADGEPHRFKSRSWSWLTPIDEEAWRDEHNVRHHQYTNIVGRDPDVSFGFVRLNEEVPWEKFHQHQLASGLVSWLGFAFHMNAHATGLVDLWTKEPADYTVLDPEDPEAGREAYRKAFRKWTPYYLKEFLLIPLLTGPFFFKSLLGSFLSELMRDVYSAATIWCGHVGDETAAYPEGTRAGGRANWYRMQVESANNFEVSLPVSMLCGALDLQIEHHLFPKLPTNRLREIAPEVRAICEEHGVRYQSASWGTTLRRALGQVWRLRKAAPDPVRGGEVAATQIAAGC